MPVINLSYQLDKLGLIDNPAYQIDKENFDIKEEYDRNLSILKAHRMEWLSAEIKATYTNMKEQIPAGMIGHRVGLLQNLLAIHLSAGMWSLIVIVFVMVNIRRGLQGNNVSLQAILAILYISGMFTSIWGSYSYDCARLMIPCFPIVILITNDLLNHILSRYYC